MTARQAEDSPLFKLMIWVVGVASVVCGTLMLRILNEFDQNREAVRLMQLDVNTINVTIRTIREDVVDIKQKQLQLRK